MEQATESVCLLNGHLEVLIFNPEGSIHTRHHLTPTSSLIDIEPRVWHGMIVHEPDTVIFEVKKGPYNPEKRPLQSRDRQGIRLVVSRRRLSRGKRFPRPPQRGLISKEDVSGDWLARYIDRALAQAHPLHLLKYLPKLNPTTLRSKSNLWLLPESVVPHLKHY